MLKDLVNLANSLDSKGLLKEADLVDRIMKESELRIADQIGERAVKKWDDDRLAEVINNALIDNPAKLAEIAKKLEPALKESVFNLLVEDEVFQKLAMKWASENPEKAVQMGAGAVLGGDKDLLKGMDFGGEKGLGEMAGELQGLLGG